MSIESVQVAAIVRRIQNPPVWTEQEFRERKWSVFCILCHDHARDTEENLLAAKWYLKGETVFCPCCNERI